MTALFRRVVNIALAPKTDAASAGLAAIESGLGVQLNNLDCVFRVKKNLKPEPNTAELRLFNLAPSTRKILETPKKLILRLEAGYPGAVAQLFLGEVRSAHSFREGPDIVTEVSTGDSEQEIQTARISMSVGPKVPANVALTAIARTLGVGLGNVPIAAAKLAAKGSAFFGPGTAIYGHAADLLTDFCRSADLEWSIQDGVLQILDRGKALEDMAVLLSPDTGLLGSPTVDNKGLVHATALIQPDIRPGRKVAFDTLALKIAQGYRIQECEYSGDTAGNDWQVSFSAKKY